VVAVAAANCFKATAQQGWEYEQGWKAYEQNKAQFWSLRGVSLDDPAVAAFEQSRRVARPRGFIQGTNVLSSFLLLGLAGAGAAVASRGSHRTRGSAIAAAGLVLVGAWLLAMLLAIHTAGAMVGLVVAIAVAGLALGWHDRTKRLAILLASGLVLLQTALVVLAMAPADLHRSLLNYRGAGEKVRTLGARLCYWEGAIRLFAADPFSGVGPSQFRKHYLTVRPAYSDESAVDVHNWLLNMAAEWGVLGALGVLIAAAGSVWAIMRALARPPDEADSSAGAALLPAMLVVLGCWALVAFDLPAGQWAQVLPYPVAISLAAGALVSVCCGSSRTGQVLLLAGLVGLLVHSTAETTASVPGVMWPFWAVVALAMAWNGPAPSMPQTPVRRRLSQATPIVAGIAVVAAVCLTVRPLRAVTLMHRAQQAAVANQPKRAMELFRSAAAADPLDPLPLRAAAFLAYRLAQTDSARAVEHFRDYAALSRAALQRNPLDYSFWRTWGLANMYLATATGDFALVDEAIRDMRRALELNPQWPGGWLELARMAAVEGGPQGDQVALLQAALDAAKKALSLEDSRGEEVSLTLTSKDRAELLRMREQLSQRLQIAEARSTATRPTP
jgi:tetratricopeptide (TPR) repeat protein